MNEEKNIIRVNGHGLDLRSLEDMYRFAKAAVAAQLVPRGLNTPEKVLIALQTGAELGMPPMVALRSVAPINGAPTIYGDAALALVRKSGELTAIEEYIEGEIGSDLHNTPDDVAAVCSVTRGDEKPTVRTFSVGDAKLAGLWFKQGPWTTHPKRMLQYKARAFALRDTFPDVLLGMHFAEEMIGEPPLHVESTDVSESKTQALLEGKEPEHDPLEDIPIQPRQNTDAAAEQQEPEEPGDSPAADEQSEVSSDEQGNDPAPKGSIWLCTSCALRSETKPLTCGRCGEAEFELVDLPAKAKDAKKSKKKSA